MHSGDNLGHFMAYTGDKYMYYVLLTPALGFRIQVC